MYMLCGRALLGIRNSAVHKVQVVFKLGNIHKLKYDWFLGVVRVERRNIHFCLHFILLCSHKINSFEPFLFSTLKKILKKGFFYLYFICK